MVWFAQSDTLFSSSSQCNDIVNSLEILGYGHQSFETCCRCDVCPVCYCGQNDVINSMQSMPTFWKITSPQTYPTSQGAVNYCEKVVDVVVMVPVDRCSYSHDGGATYNWCNPFSMYSS